MYESPSLSVPVSASNSVTTPTAASLLTTNWKILYPHPSPIVRAISPTPINKYNPYFRASVVLKASGSV